MNPKPGYTPIKDWEYSHQPLDKGGIHLDKEKDDGQPDEKLFSSASKGKASTAHSFVLCLP